MTNFYRCKHFVIQELVGPQVFKDRGEQAWQLLRPDACMSLDALREKFGPITVNNWHIGGAFKESGLRDFSTSTGASYSMHKFGGAFDSKPKSCAPKDIYDYVLAHSEEFPLIRRVENIAATPTWFHCDVANTGQQKILVVNP